ncbi:MAG: branched-chain amino acid ABC transporter permease [Nitrospirae bacterium]|nr:branched-chain amino acid ABC transporter permease [Nitrospirota bacterium]
MIYLIQQGLNALQLGSIYALIALGYTMVYGVLSLINFAHGDFFMVGAFLCFIVVTFMGIPFVPALLISMAGVAALGVAVERVAYKPLRSAPRVSAVITALGVGIFLENFTLALSPYPKHIPTIIANTSWSAGAVTVSSLQVVVVFLSVVLMLVLHFIVQHTKVGMAMRAISWDRNVAPLMGVPVNYVISVTFALGSGLGGAAGMMYAMAYPVIDPYMGIIVGWKAFISAVVGGIGNIRGAMVGGYILGGVEVLTTAFLPSTYRDFVSFSLLLVLLIFRPYGIYGRPRTEKV